MSDTNALISLLRGQQAESQPSGPGLLSGIYSYGDGLKRKLKGLLSDPAGTIGLGATRFSEDQQASNNLMRNAYPMAGDRSVLNTPQQRNTLASLFANEAADMGMGTMGGMIRTPHGRIPETSKEIDDFVDQLRKKGEGLGRNVQANSSNLSGSRYVTFKGGEKPDLQVRISNHGDRYPDQMSGLGERFSVDPDSGNTFEMAKQWLKDSGVNLGARLPKPSAAVYDDATLEKIVGMSIDEMRRKGVLDTFRSTYRPPS